MPLLKGLRESPKSLARLSDLSNQLAGHQDQAPEAPPVAEAVAEAPAEAPEAPAVAPPAPAKAPEEAEKVAEPLVLALRELRKKYKEVSCIRLLQL